MIIGPKHNSPDLEYTEMWTCPGPIVNRGGEMEVRCGSAGAEMERKSAVGSLGAGAENPRVGVAVGRRGGEMEGVGM